jgi:hypothetical protein
LLDFDLPVYHSVEKRNPEMCVNRELHPGKRKYR